MIINVKVKTNSPIEKIEEESGVYKVFLKEKPVKGRANTELLKVLKHYFRKEASIISGFNNSKKIIKIE